MITTNQPTVNGKEVKVVAGQGFNALYGGIEAMMYLKMAFSVLQKHPVDMLVFESAGEGKQQIRLAGYDLATDSVLDETTIASTFDSLPTETFWFKLDNYGDHYVGTFLLPSEY